MFDATSSKLAFSDCDQMAIDKSTDKALHQSASQTRQVQTVRPLDKARAKTSATSPLWGGTG